MGATAALAINRQKIPAIAGRRGRPYRDVKPMRGDDIRPISPRAAGSVYEAQTHITERVGSLATTREKPWDAEGEASPLQRPAESKGIGS